MLLATFPWNLAWLFLVPWKLVLMRRPSGSSQILCPNFIMFSEIVACLHYFGHYLVSHDQLLKLCFLMSGTRAFVKKSWLRESIIRHYVHNEVLLSDPATMQGTLPNILTTTEPLCLFFILRFWNTSETISQGENIKFLLLSSGHLSHQWEGDHHRKTEAKKQAPWSNKPESVIFKPLKLAWERNL